MGKPDPGPASLAQIDFHFPQPQGQVFSYGQGTQTFSGDGAASFRIGPYARLSGKDLPLRTTRTFVFFHQPIGFQGLVINPASFMEL